MSEEVHEYRIKLDNLPKHVTPEALHSKLCGFLNVPASSVKVWKRASSPTALLALQVIEGLASVSRVLGRINGECIDDKHIIATEQIEDGRNKRIRLKGPDKNKSLFDQVTPFWRIPYNEQLKMKQTDMEKVLAQVFVKAKGKEQCKLSEIKPSPIIEGYRNKAEFTFGRNRSGQTTLGLCLGGFVDGSNAVESPQGCKHLPAVLEKLVEHVQRFVDARPDLLPFNTITKGGFWRILLVRLHGCALLVGLQVNRGAEEKGLDEFREHLTQFEHDRFKVDSYHVQVSSAAHTGLDMKVGFQHVFGKECVEERLKDLSFKISPLSFFQNNPSATIVLYDTVKEYCSGVDGILLDLCCGTGTIGMYLSDGPFKRVIGVEMVKEAVEDAKKSADENGVSSKVDFICKRVEDAIQDILSSHPHDRFVVVLDPPRAGCHGSVIKAIRGCDRIERVVFVACDAKAAVPNFVDLVKADFVGEPFAISKAVPVDLFPHTDHVELVLQFVRIIK